MIPQLLELGMKQFARFVGLVQFSRSLVPAPIILRKESEPDVGHSC